MYEILLVNPPYLREVYRENKNLAIHPPLGLAYLASYARNNKINVKILDANAHGLSLNETIREIIDNPSKIVGITSVTATINLVHQICNEVKKNCNKFIVVGGPHVTFLPEETLNECSAIDCVVRGEGEDTLVQLVEKVYKKQGLENILGINYRNNGQITSNQDRPFIQDIDTLPFPAWDLLPRSKYRPGPFFDIGIYGERYAKIISSRGCPNKCTFCASPHFWDKFRFRSVQNIIDEIMYLKGKYNIERIDFLDDCLTVPVSKFSKLCDWFIESKIGIRWSCYSRVNSISSEIAHKMKEAGCFAVQFGIESGNQDVLKDIKKNIKLSQVEKAVKIMKSVGITCMGDFMIGLPKDDLHTVNQTIKFAKKLKLDSAFFSITTPLPGTQLYQDCVDSKLLPGKINWDDISLHGKTIYRNKNLTAKQIKQLYDLSIKEYYFSFHFLWGTLINMIKHPFRLKSYIGMMRTYLNI